jgi:hypothetical protein
MILVGGRGSIEVEVGKGEKAWAKRFGLGKRDVGWREKQLRASTAAPFGTARGNRRQ